MLLMVMPMLMVLMMMMMLMVQFWLELDLRVVEMQTHCHNRLLPRENCKALHCNTLHCIVTLLCNTLCHCNSAMQDTVTV